MIVWVQLPALKIHFYHKEVLNTLGNLIGRTIKLDYHTLTHDRAKFARLAVEVDLSKHLIPRIWLDDEWQKVEYENLPEVCFDCGKIGHSSSSCPQNSLIVPLGQVPPVNTSPTLPSSADDPNPGFGPWMLVTKRSRRNPREAPRKGKVESSPANQIPTIASKDGKSGPAIKEGSTSSPFSPSANDHLPQKNPPQDKNGNNGKKNIDEARKGKNKVGNADSKGKGVLGAGPIPASKGVSGPKPVSSGGASSSAHNSGLSRGSQKAELDVQNKAPGPESHRRPSSPLSQPPTVRTVTGQNGTVMQIVENIKPDGGSGAANCSSPSVASRTKRSKTKKAQSKKSPNKLHQLNPLQVWSPVKKPKSKARLASLTLQEIDAWTEAAKRPAGGNGESELTVAEAIPQAMARPIDGASPTT
ncbi:unnamed protein product [Linum trigynum]|uniref:CCHC-type domain-containing protein n=1 Tax=Linum trigynum TaxID=586398 RepID=A0AAV2DS87_9ROSI